MSQQSLDERPAVEEDYQGATQAYDESSDEEAAVGHVQRVDHGGEGETFDLPDGDKVDVLTFGRLQQDGTRGSSRVSSVVLRDTRPTPLVSVLQAEIVCDGDGLRFKSMGKTFNHVNNTPLHGTIKRYEKSALIYDGDVLRLGGNLDNKQDGGLSEHVFCVHAPALGARPAAEVAAPAASPAAAAAAATAAEGVLLRYCGEGQAAAGLERVELNEGRTLLGSGAEATCRLPLPAEAKHVTITVSRLGTVTVHAHAAVLLTRRDGDTQLAAGEQRAVFDGTVLRVGATSLRFEVPPKRQQAAAPAAQPMPAAPAAQHAAPPPPGPTPGLQPAAERLAGAGLAAGAAIAELTASLEGQAKRREEARLGLAVQACGATAGAGAGRRPRAGASTRKQNLS